MKQTPPASAQAIAIILALLTPGWALAGHASAGLGAEITSPSQGATVLPISDVWVAVWNASPDAKNLTADAYVDGFRVGSNTTNKTSGAIRIGIDISGFARGWHVLEVRVRTDRDANVTTPLREIWLETPGTKLRATMTYPLAGATLGPLETVRFTIQDPYPDAQTLRMTVLVDDHRIASDEHTPIGNTTHFSIPIDLSSFPSGLRDLRLEVATELDVPYRTDPRTVWLNHAPVVHHLAASYDPANLSAWISGEFSDDGNVKTLTATSGNAAAAQTNPTSPFLLRLTRSFPAGDNLVTVRLADERGATSTSVVSFYVPPGFQYFTANASQAMGSSLNVRGSVASTSNVTSITVRIGNVTHTQSFNAFNTTYAFDLPALPPGNHTGDVTVRDAAGATRTLNITVSVAQVLVVAYARDIELELGAGADRGHFQVPRMTGGVISIHQTRDGTTTTHQGVIEVGGVTCHFAATPNTTCTFQTAAPQVGTATWSATGPTRLTLRVQGYAY